MYRWLLFTSQYKEVPVMNNRNEECKSDLQRHLLPYRTVSHRVVSRYDNHPTYPSSPLPSPPLLACFFLFSPTFLTSPPAFSFLFSLFLRLSARYARHQDRCIAMFVADVLCYKIIWNVESNWPTVPLPPIIAIECSELWRLAQIEIINDTRVNVKLTHYSGSATFSSCGIGIMQSSLRCR